jgi:transcriptional regulator with XRE-family HTH domain
MRVNLVKLREAKGHTQQSFSDVVGISRSHYSQIETGDKNPSYRLMKKIRSSLNCEAVSIDRIFFDIKCPALRR